MLLAVLDLTNAKIVNENRIPFNDTLRNKFQKLFIIAYKEGDWCHPSEPFFHLRTSGFISLVKERKRPTLIWTLQAGVAEGYLQISSMLFSIQILMGC